MSFTARSPECFEAWCTFGSAFTLKHAAQPSCKFHVKKTDWVFTCSLHAPFTDFTLAFAFVVFNEVAWPFRRLAVAWSNLGEMQCPTT